MDESIKMRKVRPIYDAIDSGNYKGAIKMCSKKDICNLDIVKILKAHSLERLGRNDEALALCREVQARNPTDETVLSTMLLVYKAVGAVDEAVTCYENAVKAQPGNEEHAKGLFFCYLRNFSYAKQQKLAMQMYKKFKRPKYTYWAALNMLLQVIAGAPPMMLMLAERMMLQVLAKDPSPSIEAVLLLKEILVKQGKHEEAYKAFVDLVQKAKDPSQADSGLVKQKHPRLEGEGLGEEEVDKTSMKVNDQLELEGELLLKASKLAESHEVYKTLVTDHDADNWDHLRRMLRTKMDAAAAATGSNLVDAIDGLETDVLALQQVPQAGAEAAEVEEAAEAAAGAEATAAKSAHQSRGPHLAELELAHLAMLQGLELQRHSAQESELKEGATGAGTRGKGASLQALLRTYISRFGDKPCCFADIQIYLLHFQAGCGGEEEVAVEAAKAMMMAKLLADATPYARAAAETAAKSDFSPLPAADAMVRASLVTFLVVRATQLAQQDMLKSSMPSSSSDGADAESMDAAALKAKKKELRRYIFAHQVLRYMGEHEEGRLSLAELTRAYEATLSLNAAAEGGQREVQVGDDLILLAGHLLRSLSRRSDLPSSERKWQYLVEMASLLEYGLSLSGYNYNIKILLLQTYSALGACEAAIGFYNQLEVKQIQLDSLSWLMLDSFACNVHVAEAHQACIDICRMHRSHARDMPDYIAKAYKCGNLLKVVEFVEFLKGRMECSQQLALACAERGALELLSSRSYAEAERYLQHQMMSGGNSKFEPGLALSEADLQGLSINQDFGVLVQWDSPVAPNKGPLASVDLISGSVDGAVVQRHLRLLTLVPRMVLYCMQHNVSSLEPKLEEYVKYSQDLEAHEASPVRQFCWQLGVQAFQATASVLKAAAAAETDANNLWEQATDSLTAAAGLTQQISDGLFDTWSAEAAEEGGAGAAKAGAAAGFMRPETLADLSFFLAKTGHWALLLLHVMAKHCQVKKEKGKKGKKGKKGGAGASGAAATASKEEQAVQAAFAALSSALGGCFEKLKKACAGRRGGGASGGGAEPSVLFARDACAVPMLLTSDGSEGEWVALTMKKVQASQQTSMDRAKTLLDDKLALIRTIS